MDQHTVQRTVGLGGRLIGAIKGLVVGLILFVAAFPVLVFNEGYAVRTARTLGQGAREVISVAADKVDRANQGKLVHVAGLATTSETVSDPLFQVSANAIRLRRKVEMYQWKETSSTRKTQNTGGSETTTTTYKYAQVWSEQPIDSSHFNKPGGHENPPMPFESASYLANRVTLGAFRLNRGQIEDLTGSEPVDASSATLPPEIRNRAHPIESGFETGEPGSPKLGDLRVTFSRVAPAEASLIAAQAGDTFQPYRAKAGGTIQLVEMGIQTPQAMFEAAQSRNTLRTWLLRALGLFLMFLGLVLLLRPLATLADIVPIFGSIVRAGTGVLSFLLALCLSLLTIAISWIAVRPLLGIGLLAAALLAAFLAMRPRKPRPAARAAAAGAR
jgi:hypothetical protein